MTALSGLTAKVVGAADPKARAATLWKSKPNDVFSDVRATLQKMASARERCMYCEDNEGADIEHFWPKSTYPDKAFSWTNYLLACPHCNSNYKRALFPMTNGVPDLIDPTTDEPSHHLRLLPHDGRYSAIGPKGEPSIRVFDLNGDERGRKLPQGRKDTVHKLQALLIAYDKFVNSENHALAHHIKRAIINEPFSAVLLFLVDVARQPYPEKTLQPGVAQVIQRHRVAGW
jgi:uncharacterized protein (TIGR02646 family)